VAGEDFSKAEGHGRPVEAVAVQDEPGVSGRGSVAPLSGAYSVVGTALGDAVTIDRSSGIHATSPRPSAGPTPRRRSDAVRELRQRPLAAFTLAADRRLLDANETARQLLRLDLGFELDEDRVRCTDSEQAARFAKAVQDAARAQVQGRVVMDVIELGARGTVGWLDVVVASPRAPHEGAVALVVVRCRG
jgi:hypothetical protein